MIHVRKRSLFKQCRTCMQNLALLDLEPFTFYKINKCKWFLNFQLRLERYFKVHRSWENPEFN